MFLSRVSSDYTVVAFTDDHVDLVVIGLFVHEYCGISFVSWEDHDGGIIPQVADGFPLFSRKIEGGRLALTSVCLTAILMLLAVSWSLRFSLVLSPHLQ